MNTRQRLLVSAAMLVTAGVAGAQTARTPVPPAAAAMLRVERRVLDVGTVNAGTDVVGTFVFHNVGKRPIRILRAAPS